MPDVRLFSFIYALHTLNPPRFLFADPTPKALQVFRHAAKTENVEEAGPGEWINADPIPGCVVCNIGEMWEVRVRLVENNRRVDGL